MHATQGAIQEIRDNAYDYNKYIHV